MFRRPQPDWRCSLSEDGLSLMRAYFGVHCIANGLEGTEVMAWFSRS